jgi:hypothetical protein
MNQMTTRDFKVFLEPDEDYGDPNNVVTGSVG